MRNQSDPRKYPPGLRTLNISSASCSLFSICTIESLEKTTSNQYFPLTLSYLGAPLKNVLDPLRQKIDAIKSKHHFIEPNDRG